RYRERDYSRRRQPGKPSFRGPGRAETREPPFGMLDIQGVGRGRQVPAILASRPSAHDAWELRRSVGGGRRPSPQWLLKTASNSDEGFRGLAFDRRLRLRTL